MNTKQFKTINKYFDYMVYNLQGNITDFYFQALNQHLYVNFFEIKKILTNNQFLNKKCLNCLHKNNCIFLSALLDIQPKNKSNQQNDLNIHLDYHIHNQAVVHAKSFCRYFESNKTSNYKTIKKLRLFHKEVFHKNYNP